MATQKNCLCGTTYLRVINSIPHCSNEIDSIILVKNTLPALMNLIEFKMNHITCPAWL